MNEPARYLNNAKEILSKSPIEDEYYVDDKYVKSACGVAYLGVLKAIDELLLKRGVTRKELPKKVEEYRKALQKHASIHNGKLVRQFEDIYDELHIAGYYRGILHSVATVKAALKTAESFIKKME
jgi:hypothetical protein